MTHLLPALLALTFAHTLPPTITGWTQYSAPLYDPYVAINADGSVVVRVHGLSKFREENVSHLLKVGTEGASSVSTEIAFTGDVGVPSWSQVFSDGLGGCPPTHPSIAADETFILTLYDDGRTFVGLFVGRPEPILAWWPRNDRTADMAVIGIVQGDWEAYRIRTIAVVPAIPMGTHIALKLWLQNQVRVYGEVAYSGTTYRLATTMSVLPNLAAGVGQIALTAPASSCNGGAWREFTTYPPQIP